MSATALRYWTPNLDYGASQKNFCENIGSDFVFIGWLCVYDVAGWVARIVALVMCVWKTRQRKVVIHNRTQKPELYNKEKNPWNKEFKSLDI